MAMFNFSGKKITGIVCAASMAVTFILTAVLFSMIFVVGNNGILGNRPATEKPTPSRNTDEETKKQIAELQQTVADIDAKLSDPYLLLVNKSNPLPDGYVQTALVSASVNPTMKLESITELHFKEFVEASVSEGIACIFVSGYRTRTEQNKVYNETLQSYVNAGYTADRAEAIVSINVQKAGQSDFETGLAVQITAARGMTSEEMTKSDLFKYARDNMYKFGFILRYPEGKAAVTEYDYNPFVYRYVGAEHAEYMYKNGLTLEEYIDFLKAMRANAEHQIAQLSVGA